MSASYLPYASLLTVSTVLVSASHPTAGSVGLTESEAREKFGDDNVKVYTSKFTAMLFSVFENADDKEPTAFKLITAGPEEKVVGLQ